MVGRKAFVGSLKEFATNIYRYPHKIRQKSAIASKKNPSPSTESVVYQATVTREDNQQKEIIDYSIRWKVLKKCKAYSNKIKRCNLCPHEKYVIIYHSKLSSMNSRNELLSTCRHRKKFLLCSQFHARFFMTSNIP